MIELELQENDCVPVQRMKAFWRRIRALLRPQHASPLQVTFRVVLYVYEG